MSAQLKEIQKILKQNANKNALAAQQRFVPGVEKVYGVYMPVLNDLAKQFKQAGFDLVTELWDAGSLEERILAGKLLGKIAKQDPVHALQLVEKFSADNNKLGCLRCTWHAGFKADCKNTIKKKYLHWQKNLINRKTHGNAGFHLFW